MLDYCRRSANPVGRLLLHLFATNVCDESARSPTRICTALQLINFWQDVAIDYAKGRIYLPQDEMARFGVSEAQICAEQRCDDAWRELMAFQVDRARATDAVRRAARAQPAGPHRPGDPRSSCRAACASSRRSSVPATTCSATARSCAGSTGRCCSCVHETPDCMTPDEYCQQKAAASGSSFYYSFLFLPPERRRAITALYAFCREVDDVVDESRRRAARRAPSSPGGAHEIAGLFAGKPQHPVTTALAAVRSRPSASTAQRLNEIIDGMEMDLDPDALPRLRGPASATATTSPAWSGCSPPASSATRDPRTLEYARNLGIAFQLTNIIRDVGEDARKNRIYLPMDELQQFGVTGRGHPAARATATASSR